MNTNAPQHQAKAAGFMRGIDLTALPPGTTFPVTWIFENSGSSTWDGRYSLVYSETPHPETEAFPCSSLSWQTAYPITSIGAPAQVPPGGIAQLTITIIAPQAEGTHATNWQLQTPNGTRFGPIRWVQVEVSAQAVVQQETKPKVDATGDTSALTEHLEEADNVETAPLPTIDLLAFLKGDGRQYEVKNAWGSQERVQTQADGGHFYHVKNAQWEQFFFDNEFIYRDADTSPGNGRFYRMKDDDLPRGSRWLRRHMVIGDTFTQTRRVQFYQKADGSRSAQNSGTVTDTIKLIAYHAKHRFPTGIELNDVIELEWVNGRERYFYAKNYGLVGWARKHDDPHTPPWSAISEIHQEGTRQPFTRERVTGL
ncbi:MAG: hypothetical protein DHS20C20_03690 [Ardenticatenaceae bacterium]|nr:MAG: hypothetical protein DHS20C20_03690 [Ardenticatenaceae bacterium]